MEKKTYLEKAQVFARWIYPFCKRIEIAGSLRRKVQEPKDIELVAVSNGLYLHKWFLDNRHLFKIEKNGIDRAHSDIAKAMYIKYNKYRLMSVEVQILKAEVTQDEGPL
jgi:DNA polymerase/3'-5' exonuclease PolX